MINDVNKSLFAQQKMSDELNAQLRPRLLSFCESTKILSSNRYVELEALTVDDNLARDIFPRLFEVLGIRATPAVNDIEAMNYLDRISTVRGHVDIVTTDLLH